MSNFEAINRFFYFSQNYTSRHCTWEDMWGNKHSDCLPNFLMDIDWTCNREHMIGKWKSIENSDSWGRINRFYAELDNNNRQYLIDYAMEKF